MDADASILRMYQMAVSFYVVSCHPHHHRATRVGRRERRSRGAELPLSLARGGALTLRAALGVSWVRNAEGRATDRASLRAHTPEQSAHLFFRSGICIEGSAAARSSRLRCISIGHVTCIRMGKLVGAGHRAVSRVHGASLEAMCRRLTQRHKQFPGCSFVCL